MSRRLDLDPPLLDGDTAERILMGSVSPADAPPGYAGATRVLEVAARPPEPSELAGEVEAMARFLAAVREAGDATPARARTRRSRVVRPRIAVAALAGSLTLTTGLAAAGALPGPAQTVAATLLDTVGIGVPSPAPEPPAPHPIEAPAGVTTTTGHAPPTTHISPKAAPSPPFHDKATGDGGHVPEVPAATGAGAGPKKAEHGADKADRRTEKAQQRGERGGGDKKGR